MQCARSVAGSVKPFKGHHQQRNVFTRSSRAAVCRALVKGAQQQEQQTLEGARAGMDMVSLSVASMLMQPFAAWADEAAAEAVGSSTEAQIAAAAAAQSSVDAPAWVGYAVLLSPIILYAIFNVYRSQVNPRVKFTDFLFIVAGVAVVANLVSILVFKIRLF